jgi:ATP-dependent Clp protease ATP-binding subunit ClpX
MGIPYLHVDCSSLVSAGIRGYTISDILKDLLRKTHYKRLYAESAVIFFDEIDKLLTHHDGASILHQLLRLVEGTEFPINKTQEEMHEFRSVNSISTKNMLFIFAGSFQSLIEQKSRQSGFITNTSESNTGVQKNDIEKTDLPKELLGRIGDIIVLQKLSREDLRSILLHSDRSPLKKYQQMLRLNGLSLDLSDEDIEAIIDKASQSSYGARALNQALKPYVDRQLFEVPRTQ